MKMKLTGAAALLAFAGAAHAQSSVTLFGAVDSGLLFQNTSAASFNPKAPDLGKVYARGRHAYGLIPPRGALQGFDCVKPSGSLDAQISLEGPSRTVIAVGRIITAADIALLYKRGCAEYERPVFPHRNILPEIDRLTTGE